MGSARLRGDHPCCTLPPPPAGTMLTRPHPRAAGVCALGKMPASRRAQLRAVAAAVACAALLIVQRGWLPVSQAGSQLLSHHGGHNKAPEDVSVIFVSVSVPVPVPVPVSGSVYICVSVSVCASIYLSIYIYICIYIYIYGAACVCTSAYTDMYVRLHMYMYMYVHMYMYMYIYN